MESEISVVKIIECQEAEELLDALQQKNCVSHGK